jgi:hypothetical protein
MKTLRLPVLVAWVVMGPLAAAQTVQHARSNRVSVYLLGAGVEGNVTVQGQSAEIDASFSDIWSNLEFGLMVNMRSETERYAFSFDGILLALEGESTATARTVDVDQWIAEFSGAYRVNPNFEAYAAARITGIGTEITTAGAGGGRVKRTVNWVDPVVGVRVVQPLSSRWSLVARGDVGGFGVGADFTWQALAFLQYSTSGTFSIFAGYRILDVEYESGEGTSHYVYDVTTSGPGAGVSWNF